MATREELRRVAVDAAEGAGDYLRREFDRANESGGHATRAVPTAVDTGAETRVVEPIEAAFPDHAVYTGGAEGSADETVGGYRWVVDPLDGTDNFGVGLSTFSTAVTCLRDGEAVVTAVHLPVQGDTYAAARGDGATYNGDPTRTGSDLGGPAATVAFVVGDDVREDPEGLVLAGHLRNTLEVRTKRVIESWAPTVHWALLTRGLIQGVVAYQPDREEQYAGELLAREAGAGVKEGDGVFVGAANDRILAELADITEPVF
jgi:myo-inositol-1(or 4)-monophosphatase